MFQFIEQVTGYTPAELVVGTVLLIVLAGIAKTVIDAVRKPRQ